MNKSLTKCKEIELGSESHAEYLGRWFAMRQYALEIGMLSERVLVKEGALADDKRRFLSRDEWRELTI